MFHESERPKRGLRSNNVARRFNVTTRTVRYWIAKGFLRARRQGVRVWILDEVDVREFARAHGYSYGGA
jgi:DNA-binding transcriptional MerR regulator